MLSIHETETIRAALRFWGEEIAPFGETAARPYLEPAVARPLSESEVEQLRLRFTHPWMRYAVVELEHNKLTDVQLYEMPEEAGAIAGPARVATVLLPFR